jgi:hypothetical protein
LGDSARHKGRASWKIERTPQGGVADEHDLLSDKLVAAGRLREAAAALDVLPPPCAGFGRPKL